MARPARLIRMTRDRARYPVPRRMGQIMLGSAMNRRCFASLVVLLLLAAASTAAAQPLVPPEGYKLDPEFTETSPDRATTLEQYAKDDPDGGSSWQFWV